MCRAAICLAEDQLRTRCHYWSLVRSQDHQNQQKDFKTADLGHCWTGEF
jgi:hypothetical protein